MVSNELGNELYPGQLANVLMHSLHRRRGGGEGGGGGGCYLDKKAYIVTLEPSEFPLESPANHRGANK